VVGRQTIDEVFFGSIGTVKALLATCTGDRFRLGASAGHVHSSIALLLP
jgi:hypothetical protein